MSEFKDPFKDPCLGNTYFIEETEQSIFKITKKDDPNFLEYAIFNEVDQSYISLNSYRNTTIPNITIPIKWKIKKDNKPTKSAQFKNNE